MQGKWCGLCTVPKFTRLAAVQAGDYVLAIQGMVLPQHVVLLNGAPGAGKSECLPICKRVLGLPYAVQMSALLQQGGEQNQRAIKEGSLASDAEACTALLDAIVNPSCAHHSGVIVDGFPRSKVQVWPCSQVSVCLSCNKDSLKQKIRYAGMLHAVAILSLVCTNCWEHC
jgi:hypothetical protein